MGRPVRAKGAHESLALSKPERQEAGLRAYLQAAFYLAGAWPRNTYCAYVPHRGRLTCRIAPEPDRALLGQDPVPVRSRQAYRTQYGRSHEGRSAL